MGLNFMKSNIPTQNIFDYLLSRWDKDALQDAMEMAVDAIPQFTIISFKFIDYHRNYRCNVFKSGNRFFIGGYRESNNIRLFPSRALTA